MEPAPRQAAPVRRDQLLFTSLRQTRIYRIIRSYCFRRKMVFQLTERQNILQETARELAQSRLAGRAAEIDRCEEYPWDNVELLKKNGLLGMTIPGELGGKGFSYADVVVVIEEIAKVCGVTARIVVETNMGALSAIMTYGTARQKELAAKHVLGGDKPAICITEPGAGSAASEMSTRAEWKDGRFVLNGRKHWITGGGVSKLMLIFARLFRNGVDQGIAGFISVHGESKGIIIGRREPTMGLRGIPETEIIFDDLEVPEAMVLATGNDKPVSFARLMDSYNSQRVGAATVSLGIAQGAYDLALEYSKNREQFGRPICEFQGINWMLADMDTALLAARLLIWNAASSMTTFPDPKLAAQAKIVSAETAIKVTNDALQIFGAAGYSRANPIERMVRDARMFTIGGGTSQLLRNLIASRILDRKLPQGRMTGDGTAGKD